MIRTYLRSQAPGGARAFARKEGPLSTTALSRTTRRRSVPVSKVRPDAEETLRLILARLDDMKAEDIVTIDLRNKSSIADFMVVATGTSNRHVGSVADRVLKALGEAGLSGVRVEGLPQCDWVLIDAGDVIVHVFRPEVRAFYNLEKMWTAPTTGKRRTN
jgi:ribosome-associated protein